MNQQQIAELRELKVAYAVTVKHRRPCGSLAYWQYDEALHNHADALLDAAERSLQIKKSDKFLDWLFRTIPTGMMAAMMETYLREEQKAQERAALADRGGTK